jgi:hypothetical protein
MIRTSICVLVGVVLTVAVESEAPTLGTQKEEVKLRAQHHVPVPSPHAKQSLTREESKETIPQPGRIEYRYPLKGDEERGKSIKAANSWSGSPPWTCSNCAPN